MLRVVPGLSFLLALSALSGCGTASNAAGDGGTRPDAPRADTGVPTVLIGTRGDGATFTPWHDGDSIPLVWGPQGGVMITPSVAIDGALVSGTDPGLDVTLQNLTVPDHTPLADFPGYGPVHALFARLDTLLVDGPIYDQLGWSDVSGQRILVRARVMGSGIDASGQVEILLAPTSTAPPDTSAFDGAEAGVRAPDAAIDMDAGVDGGP
jgi:hypothetical protein